MPFTPEDGSGLTGANGYIAVTYADDHHALRGHTSWDDLQPTEKEQAIVRATDYVDKRFGRRFLGWRRTQAQALEWPRLDAYDDDDYLIQGVPAQLQKAVAEYALRAAIYNILAPDPHRTAPSQSFDGSTERGSVQGAVVKSERVRAGPVESETEYESPVESKQRGGRSLQSGLVNDWYMPEYPEADLWIEDLLDNTHGQITLGRGD